MYNTQIKTFIKVVKSGSFNKAAYELFISSTAVVKQINSLENQLDMKLLDRSPHGVKLTEQGKIIYEAALHIIEFSDNAIENAKIIETNKVYHIRLGVSPITPGDYLIKNWYLINMKLPNINLELYPFQNDSESVNNILLNLGSKIDMLLGFFDNKLINTFNVQALELYKTPVMIGVPKNHPLYNRNRLTVEDLTNNKLLMLKEGQSNIFDCVRKELLNYNVNIEDFIIYNTDIFNKSVKDNALFLTIKEWEDVHPFINTIPINWDYRIPFGIFYPANSKKHIIDTINILKKELQP